MLWLSMDEDVCGVCVCLCVLELPHSLPIQIHMRSLRHQASPGKQCSHQEDEANIGTKAIAGQFAQ